MFSVISPADNGTARACERIAPTRNESERHMHAIYKRAMYENTTGILVQVLKTNSSGYLVTNYKQAIKSQERRTEVVALEWESDSF